MRVPLPPFGRSIALLASLLCVGSVAAADLTPQDTALAMLFPTMHSLPSQYIASNDAANDGVALPAPQATEFGQAINVDVLEALRGGDDVDNDVIIDGNVTGNTAERIVSGSNTIQDGAFTNANGISTVIQNSGSNVLIQNGMVVNVQFVGPGL